MKQCLQCKQTYADNDLNFCLADGSALVLIPETEQPTMIRQIAPLQSPIEIRKGVSPLFAYLTIGLLALIAGGSLVWWAMSESPSGSSKQSTENVTNQPISISNPQSNAPAMNRKTERNIDEENSKNEARKALDGWVQTLREHDIERHLSFYAERLEFHRDKRNVDISYVREFNEKLFDKYSQFNLTIRNVKSEITPDGQVVTKFESVYDYRGTRVHSGVDPRTEMRWKKINGAWKIIGER